MAGLYPEIEPYDHGMLDVGDGHSLYWETCGNPEGKPAVVIHGGPGSGCSEGLRRYFDPARYRAVLFDQRGCGRSLPLASDPDVDLSANTTEHLLGDLERLRVHLGIDQWLLFGGSWGSVLGLTNAIRHPERVSEIVMMGLGTDRHCEIEMMIRGLGGVFPEAFARFRDGVGESERDGDLCVAYYRLLMDPDPAVHDRAAEGWLAWEDAMASGQAAVAEVRRSGVQARVYPARHALLEQPVLARGRRDPARRREARRDPRRIRTGHFGPEQPERGPVVTPFGTSGK